MDLEGGRVAPASCRANRCPHCGVQNARTIGGAITLASPERFLTLTQVGEDWQTVRARMKRIAYDVRSRVPGSQWCWHVEPNPKGTGHHVHLFQRGGYIKQRELSAIADNRGCGRVADIRQWKTSNTRSTTYGVKLAGITYGTKGIEADDGLRRYLAANGNRIVHATRGWWRDEHGNPCGQREAMKAWQRTTGVDDDTEWLLVREGTDLMQLLSSFPTK